MRLNPVIPALLLAAMSLSVGCDKEADDDVVDIVSNPGNGVTDIDGNAYPTIVLGNGQEWMAENLRTVRYANGDSIPEVEGSGWSGLSTGAYCRHASDSTGLKDFGLLYNFHAVVDERNLCPDGWHVPSDGEWTSLIAYLDPGLKPDTNPQSTVAGGRMKAVSGEFWQDPNTDATDISGFHGVGGGYRANNNNFLAFRQFGYWWTSTENTSTTARNRYVFYGNGTLGRYLSHRRSGLSVRCLKDG